MIEGVIYVGVLFILKYAINTGWSPEEEILPPIINTLCLSPSPLPIHRAKSGTWPPDAWCWVNTPGRTGAFKIHNERFPTELPTP